MRTATFAAGRRSLGLAVVAAGAFAVAGRPGALGGLAVIAAAALATALRTAPTGPVRATVAGVAALGPASVAVAPFAPVAPLLSPGLALLVAATFATVGAALPEGGTGARGAAARSAWLATGWCALEAVWGSPLVLGRWALPTMAMGTTLVEGPGLALAGWVGARGMSWLVIATGAMLAELPLRTPTIAAGAAIVAGASGVGSGGWLAADAPTRLDGASSTIPVRLVQHAPTAPSIAAVRLDPGRERQHGAFLRAHARGAREEGRLLVWPEAVLPRPWPWAGAARRPPLVPADADVLFGAATRREEGLFNSALLWHAGALRIVRDKVRRVPVTEDALTRGAPSAPVPWREHRIAALICWEAVFPGEARRAARAGADLLAVLANDAYAGDGPVPRLHLRVARLRAAEVGLPLAFAQATGPSAAIGPDGRVLARIETGRAGSLDADLPRASGATLYRRTGDLVGPGAVLASLGSAVRRMRRRDGPAREGVVPSEPA